MQTHFHTVNNFPLLFQPVLIDSTTDVILACVVTCAVTVLYEGLRCLRVNIAQHYRATGREMHITTKTHLLQTALYVTELLLAYFLMLAAMTYNVWLFLAVPLGALIGFQLCTIFSRSHLPQNTSANASITNSKEKDGALQTSSGQTGLVGEMELRKDGICEKSQGKPALSLHQCQETVLSGGDPDEITELMTSI